MRAYVILKVKPKDTTKLMRDLKEEKIVAQASLVHGPFDCIAELRAKNLEAINEGILRLRTMQGVQDTMTCMVIQSWHRAK